jgi:hypothetical protein
MRHHSIFSLLFLFMGSAITGQSGIIRGKVTDRKNNDPIPFATVIIQGTTSGVSSDLEGNYEIKNLNPGLYNLEVTSVGYAKKVVFEIEVSNARVAFANVALDELTTELEAAEVSASRTIVREESPVSIRTIGVNEVKRNPGGNRDISRAIQSLPGVASTPSFRNDIIIRGGAPNENRFYIDGIEIPNINHFATQGASGGPVGLINVDFIENVEFYSGAFPAARGNALSSVLEFGFKEGRSDKFATNFVVGSSDLGITVEGPTGEKSSLIASARRSYLQLLFGALGLPFLPTYNDFQYKWQTRPNDRNRITVLGLGAIDQFALNTKLADNPEDENYLRNVYLLNVLPVNTQWNYSTGVKWDHFRDNGLMTFVASRNMLNNRSVKYPENNESLEPILDYLSQEMENKFRYEHKIFGKNDWRFTYGSGYEYVRYINNTRLKQYSPAVDTIVNINFGTNIDFHKYAFFGQVSKKLFEQRLTLSGGIRADGINYNEEMANPLNQLSPRLAASYRLAPRISLNANTGLYYQLPPYTALGFRQNGMLVNQQSLTYIRNAQAVAGLAFDWDERNSVISVEGFYKKYDNYPLSLERGISLANLGADFGVVGNEAVASVSEGRAYGAEFLFQQRLYKGFYGIMAYTWVRSEFTDITGNYAPSAWDSRHLVSVTGGKKFKRNWEFGGRFLFSGGLPFTPYDEETSMLIPVWNVTQSGIFDWSRLNTERISAFHQLDIRIDKKWFFPKWSLNLFLDIQNVYNNIVPLQPILDVVKDANGQPIPSVENTGRYTPFFIDSSNGSVLPSIGIIVEL